MNNIVYIAVGGRVVCHDFAAGTVFSRHIPIFEWIIDHVATLEALEQHVSEYRVTF